MPWKVEAMGFPRPEAANTDGTTYPFAPPANSGMIDSDTLIAVSTIQSFSQRVDAASAARRPALLTRLCRAVGIT